MRVRATARAITKLLHPAGSGSAALQRRVIAVFLQRPLGPEVHGWAHESDAIKGRSGEPPGLKPALQERPVDAGLKARTTRTQQSRNCLGSLLIAISLCLSAARSEEHTSEL